jgi:hypothetical protein
MYRTFNQVEKGLRRLNEDLRLAEGDVLDETLLSQDRSDSLLLWAPDIWPSLLTQHLVAHQETPGIEQRILYTNAGKQLS